VQLGANNCTVIVGFNAQLLKYFAVRHSLSVWHDGQNILSFSPDKVPVCALLREELRQKFWIVFCNQLLTDDIMLANLSV
jgi:hypothetical protein